MSDLKPCPFCGQIPELKEWKWPHCSSWRIVCGNYSCCNPYIGDYNEAEAAVNAWNTRHQDKRKAELLRDVHNLELKLEELDKHLSEKDAIIRKQALMLAEMSND